MSATRDQEKRLIQYLLGNSDNNIHDCRLSERFEKPIDADGNNIDQPVAKGSQKPVSPPDGGWGWVVTIGSFFINMIVDGVSTTFGIIYPYLLDAFGGSKGKTQSVNSVMYGTIFILAPFTGVLMRKYGARKVAITGGLISSLGFFLSSFSQSLDILIFFHGFVGGFGMALAYPTSLVIVGMYFEKRRALATGIAVCGSGIGTLIFAPISEFLLGVYGWRGVVWIMSGIFLNIVVCAALYRPIGEQRESPRDVSRLEKATLNDIDPTQGHIKSTCSNACHSLADLFDFSLLKHPLYLLYVISSIFYLAGYQIPFSYLPAQAMSIRITSQKSAFLISVIGISSTVSRVLIGYVSDKPWTNTLILYSTVLTIGGVCTCLVPFYSSFAVMSIYSTVYGAVTATVASLVTINLVKLIGLQRLPSALGILFLCMGVGLFVGSPMAGVLSDVTGDYRYTFYLGGCLVGLAGMVCLLLDCMARRKPNRIYNITGATDLSLTYQETPNVSIVSINTVEETSA